MDRQAFLETARAPGRPFDVIVIGGGATGAGIALDAAARGLRVLLLEAGDFGHATSSRSTKIIHGGVRYVAQGRFALVREALRERALLLANAPHLVHPLSFIVPAEDWTELAKYFAGLKLYDWLAGGARLGRAVRLDRAQTLAALPGLCGTRIRGGIRYGDAQFDDARLVIAILRTAAALGATVLNYCEVTGLVKNAGGHVQGVGFIDRESGAGGEAAGRVVINATGPYTDAIVRMDDPRAPPGVTPSQGAHLVVGPGFFPGDHAVLMPRTPDDRIMFAIPWHGHVLLGTTETPLERVTPDPLPAAQEVDLILEVARRYLAHPPARADVLSCFAGIRPLASGRPGMVTSRVSREHRIEASRAGLVTIRGGKWTTYRHMAEQCVAFAAHTAGLTVPASPTRHLPLHGATTVAGAELRQYGTDGAAIAALARVTPSLAERLHPALPYIGAECVWAVRHEMARTVLDVLARRTRALYLNAEAARAMAPAVASLMKRELGRDAAWERAELAACMRAAAACLPPAVGARQTAPHSHSSSR